MWSRKDVKEKGKAAFKANYWPCVGASLLLGLLAAGTTTASHRETQELTGGTEEFRRFISGLEPGAVMGILAGIVVALMVIGLISLLLKIFVFNPLEVGCYRFFRKNAEEAPAKFGTIKEGFSNYGHVFVTLLLRDIFNVLWCCLFIIPGLVKLYSYRMVPYIIKDEPELSATQTIKKSREMMNGHKWAAFVLDLSFIGWFLLSVCTFDLVGIFWFSPYKNSTNAALYLELKKG